MISWISCSSLKAPDSLRTFSSYVDVIIMRTKEEGLAESAATLFNGLRRPVPVINAGSGRNSASQDNFPKAILPRTFDSGFTTGLMYKDLTLCLEEADAAGVPMSVANAVRELWRRAFEEIGAEKDFTTVVQLVERLAGVEVRG